MKILAFVDLHGNLTALSDIARKAKKADVVVCAGDLSTFESNIDYLMYKLDKTEKPVMIIPGNHESEEMVEFLCKKSKNIIYLEKRHYEIGNYLFIGNSGNGFARNDPDFAKGTKRLVARIEQKRREYKGSLKYVLVVHAAPYKTKLDWIAGSHNGNRTVRSFIEKTKPELVVCGHLHENAGKQDKIGKSIIVNPGAHGKIISL